MSEDPNQVEVTITPFETIELGTVEVSGGNPREAINKSGWKLRERFEVAEIVAVPCPGLPGQWHVTALVRRLEEAQASA